MTTITDTDIQESLVSQMQAHYAAQQARLKQPGEFSVNDYMAANNIPPSRRGATTQHLNAEVEAGRMTSRTDGLEHSRLCTFYRFVPET